MEPLFGNTCSLKLSAISNFNRSVVESKKGLPCFDTFVVLL